VSAGGFRCDIACSYHCIPLEPQLTKQAKKQDDANKAKEAKEAKEWESGGASHAVSRPLGEGVGLTIDG
jgi:hypothetical protein